MLTVAPTEETREAPPAASRLARWAPALVTLVGVAALTLLMGGVSPLDLLRYLAYLGWGLLVPGVLVYRLLRRQPHTLVEDLALGTVVGLCLEIAAWWLFTALGVQRWLILWPLLVVVPVLALRRDILRPAFKPVPVAWSWTVAAVTLLYSAYQAYGMRVYTPDPGGRSGGGWYVIDNLYLLSLVAEAKEHAPPLSPHVAGEPLHYHWFSFAHEAASSLVSGVDTPVVYFRLAMMFIGALSVVAVAVAGWRLTGRPWVGALGAVLMFAVGELIVGAYTDSAFGTTNAGAWVSTSAAYSVPVMMLLVVAVADRLRPDGDLGRGAWVLMALSALLSSGAKSSVLPVVIAGVGVVGLVELVTRRRVRAAVLGVGAILVVAFGFATAVLYGFESHGTSFGALTNLTAARAPYADRGLPVRLAAGTIALVGYSIYLLTRVAGIPVLLWLRRGRLSTVETLLLGGFVAGFVATLLTEHPSGSQLFFVRSAWPLGIVLSALGFIELAEKHAIRARLATMIAAGAALVAGLAAAVLWEAGAESRTAGWRYLLPVFKPAAAIAFLLALGAIAWWLLRRKGDAPRGAGALAALSLVLFAGSAGLVFDSVVTMRNVRAHVYQDHVRQDEAQAARWLRANSDPDDIVAINKHLYPVDKTPLAFGFSAFSERRQLVGAWAYVPTTLEKARELNLNPARVPYWDEQRLIDNDTAFTAPSAGLLETLKRDYGVRWLVADRSVAAESPQLRELARLRFERPTIAVYELV